jgi:hypothetical protein
MFSISILLVRNANDYREHTILREGNEISILALTSTFQIVLS